MIITLINNLYNSKLPSQYMNINDKSGIGAWGLGIGDSGLGIGTNPQSPIPNHQFVMCLHIFF